jgi:hypothetical protein
MSKLLSRADAARYCEENGIPHAKRRLEDYAAKGRGPSYTQVGRSAVYQQDELEEFVRKLQEERAKRGW